MNNSGKRNNGPQFQVAPLITSASLVAPRPCQRDERFLTFGQRPSLTACLVRGRIPGTEPAYFQDLYAERLEPREQTLQGGLISKLPMYNGLYRLHRGAEPVEVKQSLGRENAGYADLVVGR